MALSSGYFLVFFNRVAPNVLAPDLTRDFNLGAAQLGLLGSLYFWPYALLQIPAGIALGRVGARRLASAGLVLAAFGSALLALAPFFGVALLGRGLVGAGSTPFFISLQLTIRHWFRRDQFATMAGLMQMVANLGGLVATRPLAALAEGVGWRQSLILLSLAMLLAAAVVFLLVRNRPEDVGLPPVGEALAPDVAERLPLRQTLRIAWGLPSVWLLAAVLFLILGTINAFQGLWAVPFLIDTRGMERSGAAGLVAWWAWGTVFGAPSWGLLSDRVLHTRKGTALLGFALFALAWTPLTLIPAVPSEWLVPLMFLAGFGAGSSVVSSPMLMELLPRQVVGAAIGLTNATPFLGAAVYQYGIGLALDAFGRRPSGAYPIEGYQAVFGFCLLSLVGAFLLMSSVRERARHQPATTTSVTNP